MNYYWFNRPEILQKAKENYSKEKAAEYYKQNKEAIKEKSREHYKNLPQEEKDKIKEYQKRKYQELVPFKGKLFFSHGRTNSCGVAISYYGSKTFTLLKKLTDQSGRILVLEVNVNDDVYVLANLYNPNTESEQLLTLSQLTNFLEEIDDI